MFILLTNRGGIATQGHWQTWEQLVLYARASAGSVLVADLHLGYRTSGKVLRTNSDIDHYFMVSMASCRRVCATIVASATV